MLAILEPEGEADGAGAGGAAAAAAEQGPRERPGRRLLFQGPGAGPEGLRPFMDLFDLDSGAAVRRLFACAGPQLAQPGSLLTAAPLPRGGSLAGVRLLVTRETPRDVPQYGVLTLDAAGGAASEVTITRFPHPHPQLVAPPKEVIRYARADGVELSGTLYTPPGWRAGVDACVVRAAVPLPPSSGLRSI